MAELKPMEQPIECPWCGQKGALEYVNCPEDDELHVICMKCGCCGPAGKSIEAAIDAWNRRAK